MSHPRCPELSLSRDAFSRSHGCHNNNNTNNNITNNNNNNKNNNNNNKKNKNNDNNNNNNNNNNNYYYYYLLIRKLTIKSYLQRPVKGRKVKEKPRDMETSLISFFYSLLVKLLSL